MDLFDTTEIALSRAIAGAGMRQEILSANLANANTPGYIRRDVDFHSSLREALAGDDETRVESVQFVPASGGGGVGRADGNGVDLDVEASELAKNGLEYQALVAVARGRIDIIQAAMGPAR